MKPLPPIKRRNASLVPSPTPIEMPTPTVDKRRVWDTYKSDKMQIYFTYPTTFRVDETANKITVLLDYPERPMRYMYIEKTKNEDIQEFLDLKMGSSLKDENIKEMNIVTTRLPDDFIANRNVQVYETNEGWETPGPIRTVIIPTNEGAYVIKMNYSNLKPEEQASSSPLDVDYVSGFNAILNTLSIFEVNPTKPVYDETFYKSLNMTAFGFTFDYPGYWYMNINGDQSLELYDPSYGNSNCRGDCPVFFMGFSAEPLENDVDIKTEIQSRYEGYKELTFETVTTDKQITFTKVTGTPGGTYYHLFTIHNNKLYTISVGAGANAMLIDPTDPETKNDLEKFNKSLNSFRFLQ
jgi:hypothetical protein